MQNKNNNKALTFLRADVLGVENLYYAINTLPEKGKFQTEENLENICAPTQ